MSETVATKLQRGKCVPCEGTELPLNEAEENQYLSGIPLWTLNRTGTHRLQREWRWKNFPAALDFLNQIGRLAEEEGHHPDLSLFNYKHVRVTLFTHAIQGLSLNDFILAAKIDALAEKMLL